MIYRYTILIVLLLTITKNTDAQPLSAYTNFQNQLIVWDNGMSRKVEFLAPTAVAIGRYAIPYFDNSRNFKIYSNGVSQQINPGYTSSFQASDYLVLYQNATSLHVWEDGNITTLTGMAGSYALGDSMVMYFDQVRNTTNIYYKGQKYPIESFLGASSAQMIFRDSASQRISDRLDIASGQIPSAKVSDNIAAFVNYANQFKIFYHGETIIKEDYLINSFDVGRNTVAYIDNDRQFKIFHNGKSKIIEEFPPYEYAAGDDLVAYLSTDNYFKIFYNDSVYDIGYFDPEFKVHDNIVTFRDDANFFSVFYKGRVYNLDNYYPNNYVAQYNSLAYINRSGVLKLFSEGKIYDVINSAPDEWSLNYDVLQYRFGSNMYKIFYQGKTY